jgi:hypothetical protein
VFGVFGDQRQLVVDGVWDWFAMFLGQSFETEFRLATEYLFCPADE